MGADAPTDRHLLFGRIPLDWAVTLALFLLAAALRVWGVHWSLPYVIHADESRIVDVGARIVKTGDLDPHWYVYPSLTMYLQAAVYKLNLIWGTWRGYYVGPQSIPDQNHILALAPELYLWGRTFNALVGAATVAGLYWLGRSIFGRAAGLAAALLLLMSPLHIEHSHYLMTDVPMAALGVAALAASWKLATSPGVRIALVAGLLVGLCAGAKYNGAYVAIVPAVAWLLGWKLWQGKGEPPTLRSRRFVQWLAVAVAMAASSLAGFLGSNPFVLLNWRDWTRGFLFEVNDYQPVTSLGAMWVAFTTYVAGFWATEGIVVVASALSAVILLAAIARGNRRGKEDSKLVRAAWLLLLFPLAYTLLMSRYEQVRERNMVVIVPFLSLIAGYGASKVAEVIASRVALKGPLLPLLRNQLALAGLVALLLAAEPAREVVNFDVYMNMTDSRNAAFSWLQQELRQGHRAAVELHPWLVCAPEPWSCASPDIYAPLQQLTNRPPQWYAERGYDYVVLVGKEKAVLEQEDVSGIRPAAALATYMALPLVRYFPGDDDGGKGPPVFVLRTTPDPLASMRNVTPVQARYGDIAELYGYTLAPLAKATDYYDPATEPPTPATARYKAGQAVGLNLYWRSLKDGKGDNRNWTVAVHLSDAKGAVVAQVDVVPFSHGRSRPVSEWYKGEFLDGTYNVALPPSLAPGSYHLTVSLYDAPTGPALPVTTSSTADQPTLDLGAIKVGD
ncbi:MAG: glycosyltransferase family 39 protein [Chloroflexi bacterium]|nr:glycosyltransferase family 39 protein [Chloroflexota bacterium]